MRGISVVAFLALGLMAVAANPAQRIVGGSVTTINSYPYLASLLHSQDLVNYVQACAGSILNNRSILSAAHCFPGQQANRWRIRTGSSSANSGGNVYNSNQIIIHSDYNARTYDSDIAIVRSVSPIIYGPTVAVGTIAGSNSVILDNQPVWAIGWGATAFGGEKSEQLRHVQIWTVNQNECRNRYAALGYPVTDNMVCSGWLDVGGRDQCQDDAGGPLLLNNVIIGICSWGHQCGLARYLGVNTRVSMFTAWIQANA